MTWAIYLLAAATFINAIFVANTWVKLLEIEDRQNNRRE